MTWVTSRHLFSASPDADSGHIKGWYLRMPGERSPTQHSFQWTYPVHSSRPRQTPGGRTALKLVCPMFNVQDWEPVTTELVAYDNRPYNMRSQWHARFPSQPVSAKVGYSFEGPTATIRRFSPVVGSNERSRRLESSCWSREIPRDAVDGKSNGFVRVANSAA